MHTARSLYLWIAQSTATCREISHVVYLKTLRLFKIMANRTSDIQGFKHTACAWQRPIFWPYKRDISQKFTAQDSILPDGHREFLSNNRVISLTDTVYSTDVQFDFIFRYYWTSLGLYVQTILSRHEEHPLFMHQYAGHLRLECYPPGCTNVQPRDDKVLVSRHLMEARSVGGPRAVLVGGIDAVLQCQRVVSGGRTVSSRRKRQISEALSSKQRGRSSGMWLSSLYDTISNSLPYRISLLWHQICFGGTNLR